MFITRKKFEEALNEREEKVREEFMRDREMESDRRYAMNRIDDICRHMADLEREICELKGIKEKYDSVCDIVGSKQFRG